MPRAQALRKTSAVLRAPRRVRKLKAIRCSLNTTNVLTLGTLRWMSTSWFSRPTAQSHGTKTKRGSEMKPSAWFRHKDNDVDHYPTACPPNRSKNRPQEISLWAGSFQLLPVAYRLCFLISVFLTNITGWLAGRSNFYHFTTGWSPACSHPLTALIAHGSRSGRGEV